MDSRNKDTSINRILQSLGPKQLIWKVQTSGKKKDTLIIRTLQYGSKSVRVRVPLYSHYFTDGQHHVEHN